MCVHLFDGILFAILVGEVLVMNINKCSGLEPAGWMASEASQKISRLRNGKRDSTSNCPATQRLLGPQSLTFSVSEKVVSHLTFAEFYIDHTQ